MKQVITLTYYTYLNFCNVHITVSRVCFDCLFFVGEYGLSQSAMSLRGINFFYFGNSGSTAFMQGTTREVIPSSREFTLRGTTSARGIRHCKVNFDCNDSAMLFLSPTFLVFLNTLECLQPSQSSSVFPRPTYNYYRVFRQFNHVSYKLTPRIGVLVKLTVQQLVRTLPAFRGKASVITAFTKASYLSRC